MATPPPAGACLADLRLATEMLMRIPEAYHDPHAMISPADRVMSIWQRSFWSMRYSPDCPELANMTEEEGAAFIQKILRSDRVQTHENSQASPT
jgi:hypothetical protein